MKYIVKSNDSYLSLGMNGSYMLTTNRGKAREFTTYKKAKSVISNLPCDMRRKQYDIISAGSGTKNHDKVITNGVDLKKFNESLVTCLESLSVLQEQKDEWNNRLSEVDTKISDVIHYIENYNFSASEGYLLAKQLKELRIERRNIKNQIYASEEVVRQNGVLNDKLLKTLTNINCQKYTPRYYTDMFERKNKK